MERDIYIYILQVVNSAATDLDVGGQRGVLIVQGVPPEGGIFPVYYRYWGLRSQVEQRDGSRPLKK